MKDKIEKSQFKSFLLWCGILSLIVSIGGELNFHYIQGFKDHKEDLSSDIFWRAEWSIVPYSVYTMILGIYCLYKYYTL